MNTLNDLRSSLDRHADQAPDGFGLLEQAQSGAARIRRRHRITLAVVAAGAVLAVAAGVPAVVRLREPGAPVAAPAPAYHRTPSQLTLEAVAGSGITFANLQSQGPMQFAFARVAGRTLSAPGPAVSAYDPGSFDPSALRRGQRLTVAGRTAWFAVDYQPRADGYAQTLIGWRDPSGVWLTVSPDMAVHRTGSVTVDQQTMDDLTTVVAGLRIGPARDYPLPYRLGWLPPGVQVESVSTAPQAPDWQTWISLSTDREPPRAGAPGGVNQPSSSVRIDTRLKTDRSWRDIRTADGKKKTTVAGHPAWYRKNSGRLTQSQLAVEIGGCGFTISVERSMITFAELERLVGGITVADCGDPKTWGPVR